MTGYVRGHWRGEMTLARSYWINGAALSILASIVFAMLGEALSQQSVNVSASIGLASLAFIGVVSVWQSVGIWRSATNSTKRSGRSFWPIAAKLMVCLGFFMSVYNLSTSASDLIKITWALNEPDLVQYTVRRYGQTDLIFTGAINDDSVSEIIEALQDPQVQILRVNSHGGLVKPALELARYIRSNELMVMAEMECSSSCVVLLAASPYAAIYPGTTVTFHRAAPIVNLTNPEMQRQSGFYLSDLENTYREMGVADWAIDTLSRHEFWTPTLRQQFDMNLTVFVYDLDQRQFVGVEEYCTTYPARCVE